MKAASASTRPAPRALAALVVTLFALQVWVGGRQPRPTASAQALPAPPPIEALHLGALGEPQVLGQALTLWLQAFDNQPGVSIPFAALDYGRVEGWLDRLLDLDARAHYPLLMATQLYGQIPDKARDRRMYEFAYRRFLQDPNRRWPWLGHAAIMARHRLQDPVLALRYAQALAQHATGAGVPAWARQMHIFLRQDMGDTEAARILLGGLLASGQVTDEHEKRFLLERLNAMQQGENSSNPSKSQP